jgi:hypothetical protein
VKPSKHKFNELWDRGTATFDEAIEQHEREEALAGESYRLARWYLLAARRVATALGLDHEPIDEELFWIEQFEMELRGTAQIQWSTSGRLEEFDTLLDEARLAFRGEPQEAASLYLQAYEVLSSLLADPPTSNTGASGICRLCLQRDVETTARFLGHAVPTCGSCETGVAPRFSTRASIFERRSLLREEIEAALDRSPDPESLRERLLSLGDEASVRVGNDDGEEPQQVLSGSADEPTFREIFLVRDFATVSARVGHPATPADIEQCGEYDPEAYRDAFGSWATVLDRAGFKQPHSDVG